jgi:hypothetical protein
LHDMLAYPVTPYLEALHSIFSGVLGYLSRWALVFVAATAAPVSAAERKCGESHVKVLASDHVNYKLICSGAQDAIRFLDSQEINTSNDISIEIVQKMPPHVSTSAVGVNLSVERKILLLAYPDFKKQRKWLGVTVNESLYRSVVAHEVAHAIAAGNFKMTSPSIQAQEYIAYVTQFSTMQPVQRKKILRNNRDHGTNDELQMSATIYLFDPERFGVRAYRHFRSLLDERAFLHAVLAGKALAE